MPGRAQSRTKKKRVQSNLREEAISQAIQLCKEEEMKPEDQRLSLRTICKRIEDEWGKKKKNVRVSRDTVRRRLQGGRSSHQFNMDTNSWLTKEEEDNMVNFCLDYAARGFPLNHNSLKLHVDMILRARLGESFTESGIGKNWTDRFVERHSDQLGRYWSSSLDTSHGCAVNENTHQEWFKLLGDTMKTHQIEEDCLWAADETGFQPGGGVKERVLGPIGAKLQHQQRDSNRETITVIVTICADGEKLPPTVIYRGQHFSTEWHQNNTLNASIAHSPKGWTDGELGRLWIEDLDHKTSTKANRRARLLLVDGHNSHYTREFLDYARVNNIHVLCYPPHTTHVYQALDVGIFGVLKHYWTLERDQYMKDTRQKVGKGNFLPIYARAHEKALTSQTICAAFRKTGVWPLNPDAISAEMMAHSFETSCVGHMPLPQPSPVYAISKAIYLYQAEKLAAPSASSIMPSTSNEDALPSVTVSDTLDPMLHVATSESALAVGESTAGGQNLAVHDVVEALESTSASFLVNETTLTSATSQLLVYQTSLLTPTRKRKHELLDREPENELECTYQDALRQSLAREDRHKAATVELQSTLVLQSIHCNRIMGQLAAQEEKQKEGKKRKGKLMANGMPRLLTGDAFYNRVVEFDKAAADEEVQHGNRKKQRESRAEALETWKEAENERRKRNMARTEVYKEELEGWNAERDLARLEKRKARWDKPKRGKLEKPLPKPNVESVDLNIERGDGSGDNDTDGDSPDEQS